MKHREVSSRSLVPLFCREMEKQMRHLDVLLHSFTVEKHVAKKVLGFRITGIGGWDQPLIGCSGVRLLRSPAGFEVAARRMYSRDRQRQTSRECMQADLQQPGMPQRRQGIRRSGGKDQTSTS